jgi:Family of unknown function (DUF5715)
MAVLVPGLAAAETALPNAQTRFLAAIDRMMVTLAPVSAHASATIRETYSDHLDFLVLDQYAAIEGALTNGGLVPLPADPLRFNVKPRVDGSFPIGEKDLAHQLSYLSARPATLGCLLEVASRVTSGPLEISSLVRHSEYQDALRETNTNATTSVPMHTMGLAFDIALVNTPLKTIYEIRDVLRQMQDAGDILFIGERQQLVFHVVPHPSRLGHFTDVYARALAGSSLASENVIDASPITRVLGLSPLVTAEVSAISPTDEFAAEWWAAENSESHLTVEVAALAPPPTPLLSALDGTRASAGRLAARCFALVSGLLHGAFGIIA